MAFPREENRIPVTGGVSASDGTTPTPIEVDSDGNLKVVTTPQDIALAFSNTNEVVDSVITLTKTVGLLEYHKTYSLNDSGDLIAISDWS